MRNAYSSKARRPIKIKLFYYRLFVVLTFYDCVNRDDRENVIGVVNLLPMRRTEGGPLAPALVLELALALPCTHAAISQSLSTMVVSEDVALMTGVNSRAGRQQTFFEPVNSAGNRTLPLRIANCVRPIYAYTRIDIRYSRDVQTASSIITHWPKPSSSSRVRTSHTSPQNRTHLRISASSHQRHV